MLDFVDCEKTHMLTSVLISVTCSKFMIESNQVRSRITYDQFTLPVSF